MNQITQMLPINDNWVRDLLSLREAASATAPASPIELPIQ